MLEGPTTLTRKGQPKAGNCRNARAIRSLNCSKTTLRRSGMRHKGPKREKLKCLADVGFATNVRMFLGVSHVTLSPVRVLMRILMRTLMRTLTAGENSHESSHENFHGRVLTIKIPCERSWRSSLAGFASIYPFALYSSILSRTRSVRPSYRRSSTPAAPESPLKVQVIG